MKTQKNAEQNRKSAQVLHRQSAQKQGKTHPKTSVAHWVPRVKKPKGSNFFGIQISHRGQRHRFPLETANKEAAAEKARNIFLSLVAKGWEETLAEFKPGAATEQPMRTTVGALIESVSSTVAFKPLTLGTYCRRLRQIVADIENIGDPIDTDENGEPKRDRRGRIRHLSRRNGRGHQKWIAAVDAVELDVLTKEAVQAWRLEYVNRVGQSPEARRKAEITASSIIRNARSLFTERALEFVTLPLPSPLPFSGIKLKKSQASFTSRTDIPKLIEKARTDLTGEPLKIFLLAMLAGLRKSEIDMLEWRCVDLDKQEIRIEETEFFSPKTDSSRAPVDLEPELVALLHDWQKSAKDDGFVIQSDHEPRLHGLHARYRCAPHFTKLYAWLRQEGVTAKKPLHELRKELGAHLASEHGIFAAQTVLRHSDIATTAGFYADKKRRITSGLGALIAGGGK